MIGIKSLLFRGAAVLALLVPLVLGVTATGAHAAPGPSGAEVGRSAPAVPASVTGPITADTTCAGGDLCFWVNTNKGGAKGRVSGDNTAWSWAQSSCAGGTWNNCASSIQNNGNNCSVNVFENAGYGGARLTLARGTYISNLTGYWITYPFDSWNDDIQSNRWC